MAATQLQAALALIAVLQSPRFCLHGEQSELLYLRAKCLLLTLTQRASLV
jgi:hypothetical protein